MQETSSRLVRGLADFQDHQSWFEFDQQYRAMIRKMLLRKGLSAGEVDDAVQEVYLSLLSTIQRFRYDRSQGKFRSWLGKIAQRAYSARRRSGAPDSASATSDPGAPPDIDTSIDVSDERVKLCLDIARSRFDERSWLPFYLRVIEEMPIEEVQRITRMQRNAIYQCVHRVKTCLREMLSHLEPVSTTPRPRPPDPR
jgi:RNA polymerase sigma factor (sigma-70 family)